MAVAGEETFSQGLPDMRMAGTLHELDASLGHNPDGQFEQLKLAAVLAGLPLGTAEEATSVTGIRSAMSKCAAFNGKVIVWLQGFLEIVDAKPELLAKLNSSEEDLVECRKSLEFANLIVRICQGLDSKQFASLKDLTQPLLEPKNPIDINTKVELFRFLHERQHLREKNLKKLEGLLKDIGREDLIVKFIEPFKRIENPVTEESGEPALVADLGMMEADSAQRQHVPDASHTPQPPPASTITDTGPNVELVDVESHQETDGVRPSDSQVTMSLTIPSVPRQGGTGLPIVRGNGEARGKQGTGRQGFLTKEGVTKYFDPGMSPGKHSALSPEEGEVGAPGDQPEPEEHRRLRSSENSALTKPDETTEKAQQDRRPSSPTSPLPPPATPRPPLPRPPLPPPPPQKLSVNSPPPQREKKQTLTETTPLLPKEDNSVKEADCTKKKSLAVWRKLMIFSGVACSLGSCILITLVVVFAVKLASIRHSTRQLDLLGLNNDTIVVDGSPFCPLSNPIYIQECLYKGDSFHGFDVFLLSEMNFTSYKIFRNDSFVSPVFPQTNPSRLTGREDLHYLLKGSFINYTLYYSVDRIPDPSENYALYLFDDQVNFWNFLNGLSDGGWIAKRKLPFDSQSNSVQLNYPVDHSSYYFIAANTPGGFTYHYSYNFRVAYFNYKTLVQYNFQNCTVTDTHPCTIHIPPHTTKYILAYIHPSSDSDPLTTHVCIEALQKGKIRQHRVNFLPAIFISIAIVIAASVLLCFAVCRSYYMQGTFGCKR